jgi:hypothetical protein
MRRSRKPVWAFPSIGGSNPPLSVIRREILQRTLIDTGHEPGALSRQWVNAGHRGTRLSPRLSLRLSTQAVGGTDCPRHGATDRSAPVRSPSDRGPRRGALVIPPGSGQTCRDPQRAPTLDSSPNSKRASRPTPAACGAGTLVQRACSSDRSSTRATARSIRPTSAIRRRNVRKLRLPACVHFIAASPRRDPRPSGSGKSFCQWRD